MELQKNSSQIKICHVCSNYDNFYIDFMEQQLTRGLDIRVFYFRAKERGTPDIKAPYLDIRLNYSNWQRLFFILKERYVLRDFLKLYEVDKFNLIHAHTLFSNGYIAYQAKKRFNIPYIVAVRSMDVNIFLKFRFNLRNLGIDILNEAEKIIFISKSYREQVISKYVPKVLQESFLSKSLVIPNGINQFYLSNKFNREKSSFKEKLKILTVGYVSKRKNQITVCEAVERLNNIGIETEYIIIGKVLDIHAFKKILKYPFVKYIPFLSKEELIIEYRKADIFVMPSKKETFGLTYVEAMSQGLPVIYSRGQGFDGYFSEGKVGFSVEAMNVEEIVDKIKKIIDNYNKLSANSTRLSDKFNWVDIVNEYQVIYKNIIYKK